MEIHLVSTMTPDDENRLAPRVLAALGDLLEHLPVSYSLRIETAIGNAIQHSHVAPQNGTASHSDVIPDALGSPAR